MTLHRGTSLLLNLGHALDHMFLLFFATAVTGIALEFGFARWEDLMPYSAGAFLLFGIGSVPAGRLGDLWDRRGMMVKYVGWRAAFVLPGILSLVRGFVFIRMTPAETESPANKKLA